MRGDIMVTGASGGIGFAVARRLAQDGYRVFALSRNSKRLQTLKIAAEGTDGSIIPVVCDLSSNDYSFLNSMLATSGCQHLTAVYHNAGLLINKPFHQLTLTDWKAIYDVNVFGVAMLTRNLLPKMGGQAHTHIVMAGSVGGLGTTSKFPGLSAYSSSKGALAIMTECLAEEFKGKNISVNCLALGAVQTEMLSKAFPGYRAPVGPVEMGEFIAGFCEWGWKYFNGKTVPVSLSNP